MSRVKLTTAQRSAIECRDEDGFKLDGTFLVVEASTAERLLDAANAEDDYAEYIATDKDLKMYARKAAKSLSAIWRKVV